MPLKGNGGPLGDVLATAAGAPASVGSFFEKLGGAIADWALAHVTVLPGAMVAAGGTISGLGFFKTSGGPELLGNRFADVLTIPSDATMARAKWIQVAKALITQFEDFGQANGTGLTSGVPIVGGQGTVLWKSNVFVPPLAFQLNVTNPIAAAGIEAFGTQLLGYIETNAVVIGISLSDPPPGPLTAPPDGAVTGQGSIT